MGLDTYGADYTQDDVERFGKRMLDKYGLFACKQAAKLEDANIDSDTARTYKPQVRQVISELYEENPDPREVVEIIGDADKKATTKNMMVVAMKKYYRTIGSRDRGEELHELAKDKGVAEINFNREMEVEEWITKDEVERIEEYILPDDGRTINEMNGANQSWVITLEHKALVMTLFYTGCRVGEICSRTNEDEALCLDDLYWESQQMRLYRLKKRGKGYKRDMKVAPQKLWDVLEEYIESYGIGDDAEPDEDVRLFPFVKRTAQNRITDVHEAYQYMFGDFEHMDKLTPHKFRHGRVTDIANHSSLEEAGQFVEHSSQEITDNYRHLAAEQQRQILPEEADESDVDSAEEVMEALGVDNVSEAVEKLQELED